MPILALQGRDPRPGRASASGPLHTQFDNKGNVYTSLFLETRGRQVEPQGPEAPRQGPIHYNIGHLVAAEGDTVSPDGKYLVAMNKWAIDRFAPVGPLLPQNFQLIDISGDKMQLLYDLPIPLGEPHYAQIIKADKLHPIDIYPPGTDPLHRGQGSTFRSRAARSASSARPDGVHVYMTRGAQPLHARH